MSREPGHVVRFCTSLFPSSRFLSSLPFSVGITGLSNSVEEPSFNPLSANTPKSLNSQCSVSQGHARWPSTSWSVHPSSPVSTHWAKATWDR